jgi:hypothetical protein
LLRGTGGPLKSGQTELAGLFSAYNGGKHLIWRWQKNAGLVVSNIFPQPAIILTGIVDKYEYECRSNFRQYFWNTGKWK